MDFFHFVNPITFTHTKAKKIPSCCWSCCVFKNQGNHDATLVMTKMTLL